MSRVRELILLDEPALYWPLDEAGIVGTDVFDASGNGRDGKLYTAQVVGAGGFTLDVYGAARGGDRALRSDARWTPDSAEDPGVGVRATAYKPYQPGAQLTLECFCQKQDPTSFATMFSGDAGDKPSTLLNGAQNFPRATVTVDDTSEFPDSGEDLVIAGVTGSVSYTGKTATTFTGCSGGTGNAADNAAVDYGVGAAHPTLEWGTNGGIQMARWYPRVDTFPAGWGDWGTANSGLPDNDVRMDRDAHVAFTYDDATGIAELFVDGRSQGQLGPNGAGGVPFAFSQADAGNFQIGWRGGAPFFPNPGNTETWGGILQHVAVHERILSAARIKQRALAGVRRVSSLHQRDPRFAAESIELAMGGLL